MRCAFQHDIHTSDVFLLKKLNKLTLQVLRHSHLTKTRFISRSELVAIDGIMQDNACSKLPLFTKKLIYLYTNIESLNCSSQGNKARYKYLKYLDNNIFGADKAASKLWLATFLLQHGDYCGTLQKINDVLSAIPTYALYPNGCAEPHIDAKLLYCDMYRNTDAIRRARDAWLLDILFKKEHFPFVPRAIQIELLHGVPKIVRLSPFTYAYYLMFQCYHGVRQYDNRDHALRQLLDTLYDGRRCSIMLPHSCNIAGHCLLVAGYTEKARDMFLTSARLTYLASPFIDKYNSAYHYLSCM